MNYTLSKDWTPEQHAEVQRALVEYRVQLRVSGHPYAPTFERDFEFAARSVASGAICGVIVSSYLVLYVVSPLWCSPQPVFIEQMLMRLSGRPAGNFDEVQECMLALASANRCSAIVVGNAYLRPGLTRRYTAAGYTLSNMELMKEMPNG